MKNEAKKYRGKYDQSILYTYVKFSKISQATVKNILMKISLKMYGAWLTNRSNICTITLRGRKKYENETAVTFLSQRKIKESRYRRLIEP